MKFNRFPLYGEPIFPSGPVYVYRIEVMYPDHGEMEAVVENGGFWPRNKRYLTRESAEARARIFRKNGAVAKVVRSKRVEWE